MPIITREETTIQGVATVHGTFLRRRSRTTRTYVQYIRRAYPSSTPALGYNQGYYNGQPSNAYPADGSNGSNGYWDSNGNYVGPNGDSSDGSDGSYDDGYDTDSGSGSGSSSDYDDDDDNDDAGSGSSNNGNNNNGNNDNNNNNGAVGSGGSGGGPGGPESIGSGSTYSSNKLSRGAIAALAVGIPLVILALLALCCLCCRRRRKEEEEESLHEQLSRIDNLDYANGVSSRMTPVVPIVPIAVPEKSFTSSKTSTIFEAPVTPVVYHEPSVLSDTKKDAFETVEETTTTTTTTTTNNNTGVLAAISAGAVAAGAATMGLFRKKSNESKMSIESIPEPTPQMVVVEPRPRSPSPVKEPSVHSYSSEEIIEEVITTTTVIQNEQQQHEEEVQRFVEPPREPSPPPRALTPPRARSPSPPPRSRSRTPSPVAQSYASGSSYSEEIIETVTTTTTTNLLEQEQHLLEQHVPHEPTIEEVSTESVSVPNLDPPSQELDFTEMTRNFNNVVRERSPSPRYVPEPEVEEEEPISDHTDFIDEYSGATDSTEEVITTATTTVTTTVAYDALNTEALAYGNHNGFLEKRNPQLDQPLAEASKRVGFNLPRDHLDSDSEPEINFRRPLRSRAPLALDEDGNRILPPPPRPPPTSHVTAYTFIPTYEDELKIESGDLVGIEQDLGDGWCIGQNITKGRTRGLFPSDFVTPIRSGPSQRVTRGAMRERTGSTSGSDLDEFTPSVPKRLSIEPSSYDPNVDSFL